MSPHIAFAAAAPRHRHVPPRPFRTDRRAWPTVVLIVAATAVLLGGASLL